jgi:DNA-binding response OmpR family regulator
MRSKWNPLAPAVLVADDDPQIRGFVAHVLRDAAYNVHTAMNVPEAIKCLHRPDIALAVLDVLFVNSGGQSGLDALRFMRTHPHLEKVPALVLTGFPLNHAVVEAIQALGGELWHKPVDPGFLVQRVHDLVYQQPAHH